MCADFLTEAETLLLGRLSSIEEKNGLFSLLSFYKEEETEKSIKCSAIPSLYPAFSPHRTSVPYSVDQFPVFPAVVPTKIAILDQTRENPPPPPPELDRRLLCRGNTSSLEERWGWAATYCCSLVFAS